MMNTQPNRPCIFIAEDEMMLAMLLEEVLEVAGYRVLMAARLAKGLELIAEHQVDAAILDINLAGQDSFPLAQVLQGRQIPFVFASGYGKIGLPEIYQDVAVLQKPYTVTDIESAIATMLRREDQQGHSS